MFALPVLLLPLSIHSSDPPLESLHHSALSVALFVLDVSPEFFVLRALFEQLPPLTIQLFDLLFQLTTVYRPQ